MLSGMPNYCFANPSQPGGVNASALPALDRLVGGLSAYQCRLGFQSGPNGVPKYTCRADNAEAGSWQLIGSCECSYSIIESIATIANNLEINNYTNLFFQKFRKY